MKRMDGVSIGILTILTLGASGKPTEDVVIGKPAPPFSVGPWSDGKAREISDLRGKVIVLDFWGVWCGPCLHALPAIEHLRAKFESKGVVFLSVHTPGEEAEKIREVLAREKSSLIFALDKGRGKDNGRIGGMTAEAYQVKGYPSVVIIDRAGKIAFHSDDNERVIPAFAKMAKEKLGIDINKADGGEFLRALEAFYDERITEVAGER